MAKFELKLPKMGESVAEATITSWLKEVGDTIEIDDAVVEIATDKVDSDVPSEVAGVLLQKNFEVDQVVKVGEVLAVIQTEGEDATPDPLPATTIKTVKETAALVVEAASPVAEAATAVTEEITQVQEQLQPIVSNEKRFYSPLVKNIAAQENISQEELDGVPGTGQNGRVTKKDILAYLKNRIPITPVVAEAALQPTAPRAALLVTPKQKTPPPTPAVVSGEDQIIEMSRMGRLIADHMIQSKETSAHVQSFVEADVTELWEWREKIKHKFFERTEEKLTFTPLFITAVLKALHDFPLLNSSVDGNRIIQKGAINIGMATALSDGNLIVPVIRNADHLNLFGLSKAVNDLARRARENQLLPDEVQGGTYTVTNVGNFGSIMGTPIINQPQVGIMAVGVIRKMPAVIETPDGDFIGIRRKLILSHSYDHRIINGATGGQFVKNVANYLENWDEPAPI
jgi:2-oxoglutarate dehydrogenase E2 component (dihydrolipoamide succinyltransferase)